MTATTEQIAPAKFKQDGRFRVYGADSTGTITNWSGQSASFRYDHAPDTVWGMKRSEFEKIAYPIHE